MEYSIVKKNKRAISSEPNLQTMSKQDLIEKIRVLESHNVQLKNIINKCEKGVKKRHKEKSFDFNTCTFRHVLLKFIYLGYDYHGYVVQEDTTNTIEHCLFEALIKTCLIQDRSSSNYHRCGRTDKGVSSFGQVVSLRLRSKLSESEMENTSDELNYCYMLNRVLPDNIQCVAWCPINENFSARFNCKSRTYKYYFPKGKLNTEKMSVASKYLLGSHDFRNFCKMDVGNGVVKFIRNIFDVSISKFNTSSSSEERDMYVITIKGQAFLWHQIRCIMGVLFLVGEEKEYPEVILELLDVIKHPRKPDYNMASEIPLNLYDSEYDIDDAQWVYDTNSLRFVISKLSNTWTMMSTRTAMIENMLSDLERIISVKCEENDAVLEYSTALLTGVKSKQYIPLLKRPKCNSLETKIAHFVKKKRIETDNNKNA